MVQTYTNTAHLMHACLGTTQNRIQFPLPRYLGLPQPSHLRKKSRSLSKVFQPIQASKESSNHHQLERGSGEICLPSNCKFKHTASRKKCQISMVTKIAVGVDLTLQIATSNSEQSKGDHTFNFRIEGKTLKGVSRSATEDSEESDYVPALQMVDSPEWPHLASHQICFLGWVRVE